MRTKMNYKNNSRDKTPFKKETFSTDAAAVAKLSNEDETDDGFDRSKIIGRNPVIEALKAEKLIDTIYLNPETGGSIGLITSMAKEQGIVVKSVNDAKLSQLSNGASHQGVVAVGACAEYVSVEDILEISKEKGTPPFIIICDEIEDPHNLGAIIRTAEAAGADGIIIPKRRTASLNYTVFKTSAGAASWLPVARVPNIAVAIDNLKKNGIWIYGTDSSGEDYTKTDLKGAVALVIGSEGNGIGRLIKEKCDFLLKLPMLGKITSLNASVAAGIFMYEAVRQRYGNTSIK
ncbi:MAG: 23S rRNA (guanosine(2251)-2'-O)-methyltransferase RlmB [Oscillospiraceae bacterium]